jgi:thymidylate kinase
MIILINGSFGVGKTTVAELLVKRIPNSLPIPARESPCDSSMGMKRALLVRRIGWGIAGFPSPPQNRWI